MGQIDWSATFGPDWVSLPRFVQAEVIEDGKAIGLLVEEADGTVSAVRIGIEQVAD